MPRPLSRLKRDRRTSPLTVLLGLAGLIAVASGHSILPQHAAHAATTFTVNSTGDGADSNLGDGTCNDGAGNCTLRAAIQQANATAGADVINFNIPGAGAQLIAVSSDIPEITDPVVIDATTQPGYAGSPLVEVRNGISTRVQGFLISAGDSTLRGLSLTAFLGEAVVLKTKGNNRVEGNYIGLTPAGITFGRNLTGVLVLDSANNVVGGTSPAQRNVISGSIFEGVLILNNTSAVVATGNAVQGNYIGTDPTGMSTAPFGNGRAGVRVTSGHNNTVGGTAPGAGNLISGNRGVGVEIAASQPTLPSTFPTGNVVQGNLIGTNAAGTAAIPNQSSGVAIRRGSNNVIGGTAAGARNVISGNQAFGVSIDISTIDNSVQGNFIGTDATGTGALPNGAGIFLRGTHNVVGGAAPGAGNIIAFNTDTGVFLDNAAQKCEVRRNSIHSNGSLGIDLGANGGADGITFNDAGDADVGANEQQNFPVITSVSAGGGQIQIQGILNSKPSTAYTLDFYASQSCDPLGYGEGQFHVGETTATTDGAGNALFNVSFPAPSSGHVITATATDPAGNTSEFSGCSANQSPAVLQFAATNFHVTESDHSETVIVTRTGDLSGAVSVDYATSDGTASERTDYTAALGTLSFAPGETSKTFTVLITDDAYDEEFEKADLVLSNPTGGAVLGATSAATLTIQGFDSAQPNAIDNTQTFVREHYHDFLNREPDLSGLQFWTNEIESCGADAQCREVKRVSVSAAFFLSIEFQGTGYQVFRLYKASFPDTSQRPRGLPRNREFLRDTQEVGRGVVVGQPGWELQLRQNVQEFARRWVQRPEFLAQFPADMPAAEFVDKLFANSQAAPTQAERDAALAAFASGGTEGRAAALLKVTDGASVYNAQYNIAFVWMQYVGYLRRSPDAAPDSDFSGLDFWLAKLNSFTQPGEDARDETVAIRRVQRAEMVKAFISSDEYRKRFGQ
jgi:CSLREA domain-containing protein